MNARSLLLKDSLTILRQHGLDAAVEDQGRHIKIRFINTHGRACLLILSRSPSHRKARIQNRGTLRRLLRSIPEIGL
jgi:hypothetical protein